MIFLSLYRGSFYLMLFLATMTMSIDSQENRFSVLFPIAVAVGGLVAFLTVDRYPKYGLARPLANVLALASIGLVMLEYSLAPEQLLMALAHFLVYLQMIKMFLPKTAEDDWFLFLLGLMQVLVGSVISQSDQVGLLMFSWAFLSLWVLGLFSLHRDAERFRGVPGASTTGEGAGGDPYPGLLDPAFVFSALRVTALTLALGGVIFLAMPRHGIAARSRHAHEPMASHLTGFDDEVQLGQLGEILENDNVVMSVELIDEKNARIAPEGEPLWRGVTMSDYDHGRWHRQRKRLSTFPIPPKPSAMPKTVRQRIKLEATDSPVLFGLRPMYEATASPRYEPEFSSTDGTIARPDPVRPGTFDYEVVSGLEPNLPQPGESYPAFDRIHNLLRIDEPLATHLRAIAEGIVRDIPEEQTAARAKALEVYLLDPGRFSYTLRMQVTDPTLDPVEDFLVNHKQGHCEYFASALTLLLRSIGIPARMVNGFKGGDWNELAQILNVRQKHAHSWVEAYVDEVSDRPHRNPDHPPNWMVLDPTPANERQESVSQVGGIGAYFRQFTDLIRYIWVFFIVGYNSDRQKRLLYEPIRELIREAQSGFAMMWQVIRPALANLLHFQDLGQFVSIRGFFVTFTLGMILAGLVQGVVAVVRRVLRWYRGPAPDDSSLSAGVVFYRRLSQLLAEYGLERPPAETQSEFARRATVFLTGRGSSVEPVADVPRLVVDAFYRVRFGHLMLTPAALTHLESRLDALESSLRSTQA